MKYTQRDSKIDSWIEPKPRASTFVNGFIFLILTHLRSSKCLSFRFVRMAIFGSRCIYLVIVLLVLCSCSPNSSNDFQHEGEARCRMLIKELEKIENREQLLRQEQVLKKHFEALVDLMIAAKEFQQNHPDDIPREMEENAAEILLQDELRRIYAIEGGREMIERTEHEALVRLDAYERNSAKKREKLKAQ